MSPSKGKLTIGKKLANKEIKYEKINHYRKLSHLKLNKIKLSKDKIIVWKNQPLDVKSSQGIIKYEKNPTKEEINRGKN